MPTSPHFARSRATSNLPGRVLTAGALISLLTSACADNHNQDEAGARELLSQIRADKYRTWDRAPGWPQRTSSDAPHGGAVDIYVNDLIVEALLTDTPIQQWPTGSMIAKDGWDGTDLELTALMQKRDDGWFWAEYDADGAPDYSGHPDLCISCHSSGSDYVRAFALPGGKAD
jgi:hypothetical protein